MKQIKNSKPGYILVLTLMILSILVIVVTGVFYNSIAQVAFTKTIIDREKAKVLALSGIQLAVSKLVIPEEKKEKTDVSKNDKEKKPQESNEKKLLKRLLPYLNKFQTVNLKEDLDGVDGQIKISISCEDGKININKLFNFKTHRFLNEVDTSKENAESKSNDKNAKKGPEQSKDKKKPEANNPKPDVRKFLETIFNSMTEFTKNKDLFSNFQSFLAKRKFPLNDVTELVNVSKFTYFQDHMFYEPPVDNNEKRPIYLTDIFTIWTDTEKIQPWVFSDSLRALLGLKRTKFNDENEINQQLDEWLKNYKDTNNWSEDWDKTFKPLYGKDFKSLPKNIQPFLADKFAPKIFSVISYGTVGLITQRVIVILELNSKDNENIYTIKRLYWN